VDASLCRGLAAEAQGSQGQIARWRVGDREATAEPAQCAAGGVPTPHAGETDVRAEGRGGRINERVAPGRDARDERQGQRGR
jgi:hypothetical protein